MQDENKAANVDELRSVLTEVRIADDRFTNIDICLYGKMLETLAVIEKKKFMN